MAVTIDQQLAWERKQSRTAAIMAGFAAVVTLVGAVLVGIVFADIPRTGVLDSLDRAVQPGPIGVLPSLRIPVYEFYDDHTVGIIAASLMRALGLIAMGWAVTFLAAAVRFRRPEFPRIAQPLPLIGAVIAAVGTMMASIATAVEVHDFLNGPRTVNAAADLGNGALLGAGQLFDKLLGPLVLALALVLVNLNAMRLGLLTRFVGVLGIITGVLVIIPIGSPVPIVQCVWLVLLAVTLSGRWPNGTPPAWLTGRPEPWPSALEQREAAREARDAERGRAPEPAEDVEVAAAAGAAPTPRGSARRKRKRRSP